MPGLLIAIRGSLVYLLVNNMSIARTDAPVCPPKAKVERGNRIEGHWSLEYGLGMDLVFSRLTEMYTGRGFVESSVFIHC